MRNSGVAQFPEAGSQHASNRSRSMKRNFLPDGWQAQAGVVLLIAVAVGTILRFFRLGSRELSIDESLSWAESSGPSVADVLRMQHQLDSGKFPIYELAQHGWMRIFGESEAAMRALPALIGSLSIVLVFILGVELMLAVRGSPETSAAEPRSAKSPSKERVRYEEGGIYMVAAACALLFAVGLPSVEIARQATDVLNDAGVDSRAGDFPGPCAAARAGWRTTPVSQFFQRSQWPRTLPPCW